MVGDSTLLEVANDPNEAALPFDDMMDVLGVGSRSGVCFFELGFFGVSSLFFLAHRARPVQSKKTELMGYFPSVFFFGVGFFTCINRAYT